MSPSRVRFPTTGLPDPALIVRTSAASALLRLTGSRDQAARSSSGALNLGFSQPTQPDGEVEQNRDRYPAPRAHAPVIRTKKG
jgi:hypothetical protein